MPFDRLIENLEIGFNNRYILEALRAAGDEQVKLQLKGALNPMIISPMEGDKYTYLVLPVDDMKANELKLKLKPNSSNLMHCLNLQTW